MKILLEKIIPAVFFISAISLLCMWLLLGPGREISIRVPGTDLGETGLSKKQAPMVNLKGKLEKGDGIPSNLPGKWPGFRGKNLDNISTEKIPLARKWPGTGPKILWSIKVGEGYASPAVLNGRVYIMDYNREKEEDTLRCLSLETGKDIWRFSYGIKIKRNHGMSRTIPWVTDKYVVAMGPKDHVICLDSKTGTRYWGIDLVREWGAIVPDWYAGQCPIIDNGRVILAPGGKALMIAVDPPTGKIVWQTPNPHNWKMTHSSITPMEFKGIRMYVYCANRGVVGISAKDGALIWETTVWKIGIATIPSPVITGDGRIFLTGGYDAGSMMIQLKEEGGKFSVETLFKLKSSVFACRQQTPIFSGGYLYGMGYKGEFACLDTMGKVQWYSGPLERFGKGYGPYVMSGNLCYIMDDEGQLTLSEVTPQGYQKLDKATVIKKGRESWGPMVLTGGRLIVRDMTNLACIDVRSQAEQPAGN